MIKIELNANKELFLRIQIILYLYHINKNFLILAKFDKDKQIKHQNIEEIYVIKDMVDNKMFYKNKQLIMNITIIDLILYNRIDHYQTKK